MLSVSATRTTSCTRFLLHFTDSMEEKVQKFYEITSRVLLSPDKVGEIIKSRRYETLLKVFFETD